MNQKIQIKNKIPGVVFSQKDQQKNNNELISKYDKRINDIITLNEPACGGGGLILAFLKILKDNNINYQKRVKIVAQDLDFRSVYMTYIQLSLIGARAKIVQGDTLIETNVKDKERIFYTPMWKGE